MKEKRKIKRKIKRKDFSKEKKSNSSKNVLDIEKYKYKSKIRRFGNYSVDNSFHKSFYSKHEKSRIVLTSKSTNFISGDLNKSEKSVFISDMQKRRKCMIRNIKNKLIRKVRSVEPKNKSSDLDISSILNPNYNIEKINSEASKKNAKNPLQRIKNKLRFSLMGVNSFLKPSIPQLGKFISYN